MFVSLVCVCVCVRAYVCVCVWCGVGGLGVSVVIRSWSSPIKIVGGKMIWLIEFCFIPSLFSCHKKQGGGGGGKWEHAPWAQALGAQQHTFCSYVFFNRNLDQRMLKNAYFWKKCKNRLSVGGSAPEPPFTSGGWGLRFVTPAPPLQLCRVRF